MLNEVSGKDIESVRIDDVGSSERWNVVSAYCKPSEGVDVMIEKMERA